MVFLFYCVYVGFPVVSKVVATVKPPSVGSQTGWFGSDQIQVQGNHQSTSLKVFTVMKKKQQFGEREHNNIEMAEINALPER